MENLIDSIELKAISNIYNEVTGCKVTIKYKKVIYRRGFDPGELHLPPCYEYFCRDEKSILATLEKLVG